MISIRHLFLYAWILCAFILHWRLVWRLLHQEVHYLNIPVEYKDQHGATVVRSEPWPIIDVHETMHYLVGVGKILVPHSERLKYWRNSRANGEEWAQDTGSELMVPIGLYGDSAKVTTRFGSENVLAMFCNVVLWRPSSVRWSRFLIFAIPEERLTSPALLAFLRRIAWSCNHAFSGKFPVLGVQGEQLTGEARRKAGLPLTPANDRFQVTEYRGDWGWHKKLWRFWRTQWNAENVCHLCSAKGISDNAREVYWNIENNNHQQFDLTSFIANRMPPRDICCLELECMIWRNSFVVVRVWKRPIDLFIIASSRSHAQIQDHHNLVGDHYLLWVKKDSLSCPVQAC